MAEYWNPLVPELTVTDVAVTLTFYELVGFTVRFVRDNPRFAYITRGHVQFMLEEYHDTGWNTGLLERPFGRGVNFQIEVAGIEAIRDILTAHHVQLFRPLTETWYQTHAGVEEGVREFLVQDPDGYLLRFQEYLGQRTNVPGGSQS
jgi:predicted enzyme related to lactoylglutathione lyase